MKRKTYSLLLVLSAVLAGCGNEEAVPSEEPAAAEEAAPVTEGEPEGEEASEDGIEEETATEEEVAEDTPLEPQYRLNPANWVLEPLGDAPAEAVLLTIDDAPDRYALQMAETLHELEVPAIFFVNGHFLASDEKKETLEQIADLGFAIGNHTQSHENLQNLSEEEQRQEIFELNETVSFITGEKPRFFRAPNGLNTEFSSALVSQEEMLLMNWTYGFDWHEEYRDPEALTDIMVNSELLVNGANLLLHDREWTAEALPDIVNGLREKGYVFIDPMTIEGVQPD